MENRVNRKFHETLCNLLVARQIWARLFTVLKVPGSC